MPLSVAPVLALIILGGGALLVVLVARVSFVRDKMRKRLQSPLVGVADHKTAEPARLPAPVVDSIFHRYYWLPFATAGLFGLLAFVLFHWPLIYCITVGVFFFVVTMQV